MNGALLECIAASSNLFISDLRDEQNRPLVLHALHSLPWHDYSLSDCLYCFTYLFSEKVEASSYDELEQYLNQWMD